MDHIPEAIPAAVLGAGFVGWLGEWFPADAQGWAVLFSTVCAGLYYLSMYLRNRKKNNEAERRRTAGE